jgi:hypothetical protein
MAALADVLDALNDDFARHNNPMDVLIAHEVSYWRRIVEARGEFFDENLMRTLVAVQAVTGAKKLNNAQAAVTVGFDVHHAGFPDAAPNDRRLLAAYEDILTTAYSSGDGAHWGSVGPDRPRPLRPHSASTRRRRSPRGRRRTRQAPAPRGQDRRRRTRHRYRPRVAARPAGRPRRAGTATGRRAGPLRVGRGPGHHVPHSCRDRPQRLLQLLRVGTATGPARRGVGDRRRPGGRRRRTR